MFKKTTIISLGIFFILIFLTPIVKNNTRIIEKNIEILSKDISILEKQLNDAQIDFVYLSSPERLKKNLLNFNNKEYSSFKRSRIFLSPQDFLHYSSQETKNFKIEK
tara:strand:+ start:53 stop:373 length:321 start_codon:yes stop_codon:yes gene_type:complete